jgi:hypothetical protein
LDTDEDRYGCSTVSNIEPLHISHRKAVQQAAMMMYDNSNNEQKHDDPTKARISANAHKIGGRPSYRY